MGRKYSNRCPNAWSYLLRCGDGIFKGRICDPSGGGWVVGANVYISLDYDGDGIEDRRLEDTTDSEGFELDGLTVGLQTVYIQKGSFSSSFEVDFPEVI